MAKTRLTPAFVMAGVVAALISSATACSKDSKESKEPVGASTTSTSAADPEDIFEAVGTGTFVDKIGGFRATGDTAEEASNAVIAACKEAGGQDCTSDEVTNDNLCIVSVADDVTDEVSGGAGKTVEEAKADAFARAAKEAKPMDPSAVVVISACP